MTTRILFSTLIAGLLLHGPATYPQFKIGSNATTIDPSLHHAD
ncbi:hypothetical protein [Dyadobacter endophyticus]|nr:hypothetical protein [Dyadobacter endophyticus]